MGIFDPFSALEPARARKQIEVAVSDEIFDRFSVLDERRAQRQIEAELGVTVFDKFSSDTARELAQIDAAVEAGAGVDYVGELIITNDDELAAADLEHLRSVSGAFTITGVSAVNISAPLLQRVNFGTPGTYCSFINCLSLQTLDLRKLREANAFTIQGNPLLDSVNLSAFETLAVELILQDNTALLSFALPAITHHGQGGGNSIAIVPNSDALTSISFGSGLKEVEGDVYIYATLDQSSVDSVLVRLAALNGTNGTTSYHNKTVDVAWNSAAPSAAGLAAKATLQGRGCTVNVN